MAAIAALKRFVLVFEENCPLIAAATAATMRASVESCCPLGPGAAGSGTAVSGAGAAAAARSAEALARALSLSAF